MNFSKIRLVDITYWYLLLWVLPAALVITWLISLLIVSDKKKDYASTDGMRLSRETSEFLKVFITYINFFNKKISSV